MPSVSYRRRGVVLLEVVLAVALFFITAAIVVGGVNSSVRAVGAMADEARGADIAVSVMSELHMASLPLTKTPATALEEPLTEWSYSIEVDDVPPVSTEPPMSTVTVAVFHRDVQTYSLVEMMPRAGTDVAPTGTTAAPAETPATPAGGTP